LFFLNFFSRLIKNTGKFLLLTPYSILVSTKSNCYKNQNFVKIKTFFTVIKCDDRQKKLYLLHLIVYSIPLRIYNTLNYKCMLSINILTILSNHFSKRLFSNEYKSVVYLGLSLGKISNNMPRL